MEQLRPQFVFVRPSTAAALAISLRRQSMARTAISPVPRDAAGKPPLASKPLSLDESRVMWRDAFRRVRAETESRAAHLSAEDQIVQSMADASPAKWHRAHVTWFFEQFLLVPNDPAYKIFDQRFPFLFNSYYAVSYTHL